MEVLWKFVLNVIFLAGLVFLCSRVESCNETICASIVSKCMLTQSCKCELKNTTCCKECVICLGKDYYEECCSCVGMFIYNIYPGIRMIASQYNEWFCLLLLELCPKPNETLNSLLSHVEEFNGIPDLFNVLAFSDEIIYDWHRYTFPVDFDAILSNGTLEKDIKFYLSMYGQSYLIERLFFLIVWIIFYRNKWQASRW